MRIAYGVHGYGRGHAMRALAVLPELVRRHEVLLLAGGDAYNALVPDYAVERIPHIGYYHNRRGQIASFLTLRRNTPLVMDVLLKGPTFDMIAGLVSDFRPDVVLTDSEIYTHWVARALKIPRITFDHFGVLVYCRPEMSRMDRLICWGQSMMYRALFGRPDRAVVSAFFAAPPRRPGICAVGAVIRREVRQARPSRGQHMLVYINKAEHEYTPRIEQALLALDCPVRVYGTARRGTQDNLHFKPISNLAFIEDLAGCRAVFATTGNQLCGEVLYFGKPMLGMPMACLEQRLNAQYIERMGVGMQAARGRVTVDLLRRFLAREPEFVENARRERRDGAAEALEAIDRFGRELAPSAAAEAETARHQGST